MTKPKGRKPGKPNDARRPSTRSKTAPVVRAPASQKIARARSTASTSGTPIGNNRARTKQSQVIAMLRAPAGATIEGVMRITGWQQHSVRGFLAAVVRKKLGLNLSSTAAASGRIYRVTDDDVSAVSSAKANKAA